MKKNKDKEAVCKKYDMEHAERDLKTERLKC